MAFWPVASKLLRRPCANLCDSAVPAPPPLGGALNLVMGCLQGWCLCGNENGGFAGETAGASSVGRFRRYGLTAPNIAEIAENKK